MTRHHSCRVSPFGHPRITARLTAPRGISQPPTSFIGSQCQGIHHAPLNTYKHKTNIRNCTSENTNHNHRQAGGHRLLLTRCSQPLSTNQTPHTPPPKMEQQQTPPTQRSGAGIPSSSGEDAAGPVVSKPNSVSDDQSLPSQPKDQPLNPGKRLLCTRTGATTAHSPSNESLSTPKVPQAWAGHESRGAP